MYACSSIQEVFWGVLSLVEQMRCTPDVNPDIRDARIPTVNHPSIPTEANRKHTLVPILPTSFGVVFVCPPPLSLFMEVVFWRCDFWFASLHV